MDLRQCFGGTLEKPGGRSQTLLVVLCNIAILVQMLRGPQVCVLELQPLGAQGLDQEDFEGCLCGVYEVGFQGIERTLTGHG